MDGASSVVTSTEIISPTKPAKKTRRWLLVASFICCAIFMLATALLGYQVGRSAKQMTKVRRQLESAQGTIDRLKQQQDPVCKNTKESPVSVLLIPMASAVYVDEPLLYDTFPPDFMWATATASYQIEGGWDADGKGLSIWDVFTKNSSNILDGSSGHVACNSYELYEKDIEALQRLNVSHYRFSISWPRVLPDGIGRVNEKGIDYYKRLISALLTANIQPIVTLYHWDLPQALEEMGGWLNPAIADWFTEYAQLCFNEFGKDVKLWITLNEPFLIANFGYGTGIFAPGKQQGPGTFVYQAGHNLLLAHAKVYRLYDQHFRSVDHGRIGITLNNHWYQAKDATLPADRDAAQRATEFMLGWFADPIFGSGDYPSIMKSQIAEKSRLQGLRHSRLPEFTADERRLIKGSSDFFGLNHYTSFLTENKPSETLIPEISYEADQDVRHSVDSTWYRSGSDWLKVVPSGIRSSLNWIKNRYANPEVIITENGFSDRAGNLDDAMRVYYYRHYINNVLKAIKIDGVNVTGYTAWSLMDLFEWTAGFTEKFGLFSIDFSTKELDRTAKVSARYYAGIIRDNGFVKDEEENKF